MFIKHDIDLPNDIFTCLSESIKFEKITEGRLGAILVDNDDPIPIARSTTKYNEPVQKFIPVHYDIINKIRDTTKMNLSFNNAMIEIYDPDYCNMKYHSDQSLDLKEDSYICIFSCYNDSSYLRKLKIKSKETHEEDEITLDNNSVVLWDLSTNLKYLHKIILETNKSNNKWLGITFRLSKTFIKFVDEIPYFSNGDVLVLANDSQKKEFYKMRDLENSSVGFVYPEICYTISISDMMSI